MKPTLKKTKFGRKDIQDDESTEEMDEKMDLRTILICIFLISLKCYTISLTLPYFFKSKEMEESLVEVEKEHSLIEEKHSQRVVTIDSSEGSNAQKVTRHIRPLYVRAHFNGNPVSKVLVDNGSGINVMPLRTLRALGRGIDDLIETKVFV